MPLHVFADGLCGVECASFFGGRGKDDLALISRCGFEKSFDIVDMIIGEHIVGLVDYDHAAAVELEFTLYIQLKHTAHRADDHVGLLF